MNLPRRSRLVLLVVVAALGLCGCGVKKKPEKEKPVVAPSKPAPAEPQVEVKPMLRAVSGGLEVQVTQDKPGVFRFDVKPAKGTVPAMRTLDGVSFDASNGTFVVQAWTCRLAALDKFGRANVPGLELSWKSLDGEALYGLGERFDGLNQVGKVVDMWIEDAPGQGDANRQSYYVTPVLYSTRGYAFFAAQNPEGVFDLNSAGDGLHRYRRAGQAMTFYVAFGDSLKELVGKRESVQGPHKGIPDWAWGPWISRNSFESQAEAEEAINGMVKRKLPVAAIVQEAWKGLSESGDFNNFNPQRWPDLDAYFALCRKHDVKNVLWQVPIIHPSSPEFAVGKEKGYFVKKPDGSISFRQNWLKDFANVDFTNPDAVKFWQDLIRPTVKLGIWGFKADDGEDIKPDDVFFDGRRGWEMHNEYSTLYNRALTELMEQEGVDGLLWARSGSLGNEQYPALWAGDQYARWDQLASLVPAGLSASMSGMPFWGHDIGGYVGQPTPELYIRWAQFGALSPLMQYHGVWRREPWEFGPLAEEAYTLLAQLRMNLKPTLIELGHEVERAGLPIMRPMSMEFPQDDRFAATDDQYMLGPDMLVAPVLEEGHVGRAVQFPAGVWQHALWPVSFEGPATREVPIGLLDAPLFVREGATLKLQLAEGARLGRWQPADPVRDVSFAPTRAVIRNLKAPLRGSVLARTATVEFDRAPGSTNGFRAYWFLDADPARRFPAGMATNGGQVFIDLSPGSGFNLLGRLQTYVIETPDGAELFRGSIRWETPVALEIDRSIIKVVKGGRETVETVLVNRSAAEIEVRVVAEASAGGRVATPAQTVTIPAQGRSPLRWEVDFDASNAVGDTRVLFRVLSGGALLAREIVTFARVSRWIAVGPFPAPQGKAYSTEFGPEGSVSAGVSFRTPQGTVKWEQVSDAHVARFAGVDFNELYGQRDNAAAYALTKIVSDRQQDVALRFGSDDTLTVWLNGGRIYSVETYRLAAPDQEIVKARLREGVNTIMVKIAQDKNPWKFYFRVTAPNGAPVLGLRDGFSDYTAYATNRAAGR